MKGVKKRRPQPKKRAASGKGNSKLAVVLLVVAVVLLCYSACYRTPQRTVEPKAVKEQVVEPKAKRLDVDIKITSELQLPLYTDSTFLIRNSDARYAIMYDTMHCQPRWVAYMLTAKEVGYKGVERSNRFKEDPFITIMGWEQASNNDYKGSGYDKGHLLPSADRDDSRAENDATFLFSNISPQLPSLNRRVWAKLEGKVREWAAKYDTLYVVTAPILSDAPRQKLGNSSITIPDYFYKVLMARQGEEYVSIGFVLPNRSDVASDINSFAKSVDEVEALTGIDFFWMVEDSIESRMESEFNLKKWN